MLSGYTRPPGNSARGDTIDESTLIITAHSADKVYKYKWIALCYRAGDGRQTIDSGVGRDVSTNVQNTLLYSFTIVVWDYVINFL